MTSLGVSIVRRGRPASTTFVLTGALDVEAVGDVEDVLGAELDNTQGIVELDLSHIDFVGFAGTDLLVRLAQRCAASGRRLRVAASNRVVDRTFELAGTRLAAVVDTSDSILPTGRSSRVPGALPVPPPGRIPLPAEPPSTRGPMSNDFMITVTEIGHDIEIAVTGELDIQTTARLQAELERSDDESGDVVVDLSRVSFIDSTALAALLDAERRLAATGRRLRIGNPSAIVARVLAITDLDEHFDGVARSDPAAARPPATAVAARLHDILHELALLLLTEGSLRADLDRVVRFACGALPRCDAASVALLVDGLPSTVAVTDHVALELDIVQYDKREGPCLDALDGQPIRVSVLGADERFTHFAAGAAAHEINSVLSMPITHAGDTVGTLNLYGRADRAFDSDDDGRVADIAAAEAAHAVARSDVAAAAHRVRDRLQVTYDEAALTARAQGILVALQQCSAEQARHLLEHAAATNGEPLVTVARRVLDAARADPPPPAGR